MKKKKIYGIISLFLFITSVVTLIIIDKTNKVNLSLVIQVILILYLIKITYGCVLYVKEKYTKKNYSYGIIMNLGYILFLFVNIVRQINLLIVNFSKTNISDIYNATLESFDYFAVLFLPGIIILSIYLLITNIVLLVKEGVRVQNLLGVFFSIFAFICLGANQIIYLINKNLVLNENQMIFKQFIILSLNSVITYFYCLIFATLYSNIVAAKHNPRYDKDFVIILGCQVRKDGTLTPLLKGRVDRAIEFAQNQKNKTGKDIIYIPSGGKGKDETISEAEAIKKYLLGKGVKEENIIIEDESTSTKENMRFSKNKIDEIKKEGNIAFSTTSYHVFRSGVIANDEGIYCEGMGSKTKWYFYANALLREFFANLIVERGKHFFLITSVNIAIFILVMIGHIYKL